MTKRKRKEIQFRWLLSPNVKGGFSFLWKLAFTRFSEWRLALGHSVPATAIGWLLATPSAADFRSQPIRCRFHSRVPVHKKSNMVKPYKRFPSQRHGNSQRAKGRLPSEGRTAAVTVIVISLCLVYEIIEYLLMIKICDLQLKRDSFPCLRQLPCYAWCWWLQ